jgi:hypothetical protein
LYGQGVGEEGFAVEGNRDAQDVVDRCEADVDANDEE